MNKPLRPRSSRRTDTRRSRLSFGPRKTAFVSLAAVVLALLSVPGFAQEPAPAAFHLRVTNAPDGAVKLSVDNGTTWLLVARVNRHVTTPAFGAGSDKRDVLRSNQYGMAFSVGKDRLIRVLPDIPANRKTQGAILLNVPATAAVFKDFLPPAGTPVRYLTSASSEANPLPEAYYPKEEDTLEFVAPRTASTPGKIAVYAKDAERYYLEKCLTKLRLTGKKPISGSLFVSARLKPGDVPNAVTFLHEGSIAGIMNAPPFSMRWDTKQWPDGEHLVEVRALDKHGAILSRSKALVVVQNRSQS